MYHRLKKYLEHFKILCPLLFGFSEKSSTMHAVISITESSRQAIDNNNNNNNDNKNYNNNNINNNNNSNMII